MSDARREPAPNEWRLLVQEAIDLLTERKYGNPARSPGHNARLMLQDALAAAPTPPAAEAPGDWRDDPAADERWNEGLDYHAKQLCAVLGVDPKDVSWDAATEELEGDVRSVIGNILTAAMGESWMDRPAAEAPGQEPVAVKPLEWADDADVSNASGYRIEAGDNGRFYVRSNAVLGLFGTIEIVSTLGEAKAAAQADYEQRIRSALVSAPITQEPKREHLEWRPVVGAEGLYEISSAGDLRRAGTEKILSKCSTGHGYVKADLWVDGKRTQTAAHILVAKAFLERPVEATEVNHKDGNKTNNRVENLEWTTRSGNELHSKYVLGNQIKAVTATDVETGAVTSFPSIEYAGRNGAKASSIYKCLKGMQRTHRGKTWAFAAPPTYADAEALRENLDRVTDHLSIWAADHPDEATTETHAALYCARDILARTAAIRSLASPAPKGET